MIWNIPNSLSLARLFLFLPVLWVLAVSGKPVWLGAVLLVALLTDVADGCLARALNQVTALGAKLDSIADAGLLVSSISWLVILRPEVLLGRTGFVLAVSVAAWTAAIAIGWVRFRRFANLHLYSHKAAAVIGGAFLVVSFMSGFQPWIFHVAAGASIIASVESIILLLTRDHVDEHMGSLLKSAHRRAPSSLERPAPSGETR